MNAKRYARRLVAMVASAALMGGAGAFVTGSIADASSNRVTATTGVNARSGPGTTYQIVKVLSRGSLVSTTGKITNGFSEITYADQLLWVSTQYLKASEPTTSRGVRTMYATTALDIRSVSASKYKKLGEIPKGAKVSVTGVEQSGRAQIVWGKSTAWVTEKYLQTRSVSTGSTASSGGSSSGSSLPKITGTRYATTALMIRTTSSAKFTNLGDVATGTKLSITGKVINGRMQIVYGGAVRYVTAQYLSSSKPSSDSAGGTGGTPSNSINGSGLTNLQPHSKALLSAIRVQFPQFTTFYGVRPDSIPDHPSGRALDSILPGSYRSASSRASGKALANWAAANARALHIEYIIWDQHIWNVNRSSEGWRYMADRGGDTANHKDHVHITIYN